MRISSKHRIYEPLLAFIMLSVVLVFTQSVSQGQGISIRGRVVDEGRLPVAGAEVLCRGEGVAVRTISDHDGEFSLSGLKAGRYSLTAAKGERQSAETALVVASSMPLDPIEVILGSSKSAGAQRGVNSGQPMEYTDNPSFTIAGVTDWTAAGGHGSDATLRTSEALNRETLTLKPDGRAASNENSARNSSPDAEAKLRSALAASPESFDLNRQMGELYLRGGRYAESLPFLQKALAIKPGDATIEFALAGAYEGVDDPVQARQHIEPLLSASMSADVHRLAGEIYEKNAEPLLAVHEFARAAQLDPSETDYFEWGTELLYHRAVWQAKQVFEEGVRVHPTSARLLTSLGAALFAGALYDDAEVKLCAAADLDPDDPDPYLFMGKVELASQHPAGCVATHLARFAQRHPENALSSYFYAMAIWKQHGDSMDGETRREIATFLTKAVTVDPKCSDAYLQLGNLSSLQSDYAQAIEDYRKAIETNPRSSEAHYRLAVAYDRTGERTKANQEFALHDEIAKQEAARVESERKAIKQFVVDVSRTGTQKKQQ